MELIIAEKPAVALKMAYAIAQDPRSVQRIQRGRVSSYKITRDNREIIIAPAVGHLYSLKEIGEGRDRPLPVFDIEWKPAHEINKFAWYMRGYLDNLADMAKKADKIIIATDYDLEGDLIGANIVRHFGNLDNARRMRFSTLAPSELLYAYENLEDVNIYNIRAAETRHMIDWMYGINLSRAIMHALRTAGRGRILSIGRVQGPFLKFLVERQREIENFISQDFWELYATAAGTRFKHEADRFFSEAEAAKAQSLTPPEGKIEVRKERKSIYPPPPFDFTALQVEAYRNFGFSPIQTEQIAQTLYTNAQISYPRTSSQKLPRQLNLPAIIEKLSKIHDYNLIASQLLRESRFRPREGTKEDVHPAIHPTGIIGKMGPDERKLYDLIVSRFLACFMEPAEIEDTKMALVAGTQRYLAAAKSLVKQGWLQAYKYHNMSFTEAPSLIDGQAAKIDKFEIMKKQTAPPYRYTPATIIQELEELDVGTKTTRALILDALYKRGYVTGRQINVTPLGLAVFDAFNKYVPLVVDPELTRKLEREMESIQEDKMSQEDVLNDAKQIITDVINEMKRKEKEIGDELLEKLKKSEEFAPCKCGGKLRILQKGRSKFLGCTNYPKCRITYSLPYGLFNYAEQCPACGAPVIWFIKGKQRFKMCLNRECPIKVRRLEAKEKEAKEMREEKEVKPKTAKITEKGTKTAEKPKITKKEPKAAKQKKEKANRKKAKTKKKE
jgi:DNA topoisomerase-1